MSSSVYLERILPYAHGVNDTLAQSQWAGKKWVWVSDKDEGYLPAHILTEDGDNVTVELSSSSQKVIHLNDMEKMNPPKFDKVEDMADLTHLNESSVIHNLRLRYTSNLIYTYSGLFLVAVNPYKKIPIYSDEFVRAYKGKKRSEIPPHIFAVADAAYADVVMAHENQSILITGESGAGKTENTKKVIQYLTSIASTSGSGKPSNSLEHQILQANPILESFGNAQTIRNNNSSRFGKFIRIEFGKSGQITGANIDKYLLEKSRVTHQSPKERNFHIFYQLIRGAADAIKDPLLLSSKLMDYTFTKSSNMHIEGVDDAADFLVLQDSLKVVGFSASEQKDLFTAIAAVLHLGNITVRNGTSSDDQAELTSTLESEKACHVLGIQLNEFTRALLRPKIKAGRDYVTSSRNASQVSYSIEALARALYERMFAKLVERINTAIYTPSSKSTFIGVLDIAGFEIFDFNSFEQLCINYTNERLQQYFNHHMFILEQEEYHKEGIEWKFIDFGLDLQPTIDLIEKTSPIGILSLLDEECVMPKASDRTFIDKLNGLWKGKSAKYSTPRFNSGFLLTHYAGVVEYSTDGWLDKNKDPLNDNITKLLAFSSDKYIASLFSDCADEIEDPRARTSVMKRGAFRTVAQRHKESLGSLMQQLYSTQPHFVRCIIPNEEKRPGKIAVKLVLDQLRCNGVLEGIRICRAGFPNRLIFADFKHRYEFLATGVIPKGFIDGKSSSLLLLEALSLDKTQYRVGCSKVFFKAGVLAQLEERRDKKLSHLVVRIQAIMRGFIARKNYRRRVNQLRAIKIIQKNARVYVTLRNWAWWKLYSRVKPLLNVTRIDEEMKKKEAEAKEWEDKAIKEEDDRKKLAAALSNLEAERTKLEAFLIQEKNAAADQAEILSRTQKREMDLQEQLKAISIEVEDKSNQLENLVKAKKALEKDLLQAHATSDDLVDHLKRFEIEKSAKDQQIKDLEAAIQTDAIRIQRLEEDKKVAERDIAQFNQDLEAQRSKEAEMLKSKLKLESMITDLEQRLEQEQIERKKLYAKKGALEIELEAANHKMLEVERALADAQSSARKREGEYIALGEELKKEQTAHEALSKQRHALQGKYDSVEMELEGLKMDFDRLGKAKKSLAEELHQLQYMIEQKGSEESKQSELRRLRDAEVTDLKAQLAAVVSELEDVRRTLQETIEKANSDLEAADEDCRGLQKTKAGLEKHTSQLTEDLERSEESVVRLEKAKRTCELELSATKLSLEEREASLADLQTQKEVSEKQISSLILRAEESESRANNFEREKQFIARRADSLQIDIDDLTQKYSAVEASKKKLSIEINDLHGLIEEEKLAKFDSEKKLTLKLSDLECAKDRLAKDLASKTEEHDEYQRRIEQEMSTLRSQSDEQTHLLAGLEKTKARLTAEAEDLKLEVEREHNATRNAERNVKQVEAKLSSANNAAESERELREKVELTARALSKQLESLQSDLLSKSNLLASMQRSKSETESEFKALISEIGDGGKNIHELEKIKRRLEARVQELEGQLDDESVKFKVLEGDKESLEGQLQSLRKKAESDLSEKDRQMEETRKLLMKEVNSLGEQLDDASSQRNEAIKARKKLEDQLNDMLSQAESSAKGQSDLAKIKSKHEATIKQLQSKLDDEVQMRSNMEEISLRHEAKANSLQTELERCQLAVDVAERAKKQAEKSAAELHSELFEGEDSKAGLLEIKAKLQIQVRQLQLKVEELEESIVAMQATQRVGSSELESLRNKAREDFAARIESLEESRRALLASQRLANQQIEDKNNELFASEKAKKALSAELEELRVVCETEIAAKNNEAAAKRKLTNEVTELTMNLEIAQSKCIDMEENIGITRTKADSAQRALESAELRLMKLEKSDASYKLQVKEMEEASTQAQEASKNSAAHVIALEEQIMDLHGKCEENALEISSITLARRKVSEESERMKEAHKRELEEQKDGLESLKKKFQKEVSTLLADLDKERADHIALKEVKMNLFNQFEMLQLKCDEESRSITAWRKDKEKMETKVSELTKNYTDLLARNEHLSTSSTLLSAQLRDLTIKYEEADSQRLYLNKCKKSLEEQLDDARREYHQVSSAKSDMQRSFDMLGQAKNNMDETLVDFEEDIKYANERAKRLEATTASALADLSKVKEINLELEKGKHSLERNVKELSLRVMELEMAAKDGNAVKRLEARVEEITRVLECETREKGELVKNNRKAERLVRELQFQLNERDKAKQRLEDESEKAEARIKRMKAQIEELEALEETLQLSKRRAEREAVEFKEKSFKFEKEIEKMRLRGGSGNSTGTGKDVRAGMVA